MITEFVLLAQAHCSQNPLTEILSTLLPYPCSWQESRLIRVEQHVVLLVRLSGNWDVIAKMEQGLQNLERRTGISCMIHRPEEKKPVPHLFPYNVQVVLANKPGEVLNLLQFFIEQGVILDEFDTDPYMTYTGTQMLALSLNLSVPDSIQISDLRERFMLLCDNHNMDGIMEPIKN